MPVSSGIDFINNQKKKGCKVKNVAIMSGLWSNTDIETAKNNKCRIFYKPFNITEINRWLVECEANVDPGRVLNSWT